MVLYFEQETTGYILNTCVSDQGAIWGYCGRMGSYASLTRFSYHQLLAHCHVNALTMCFLSKHIKTY